MITLKDMAWFGIINAITWTLGGIICAVIFYQNLNNIESTEPTPELVNLAIQAIVPWTITGFIIGIYALNNAMYHLRHNSMRYAYAIHIKQMTIISLIIGILFGSFLYPMFTPPDDVALISLLWRIPLSAIISINATHSGLKMCGNLA